MNFEYHQCGIFEVPELPEEVEAIATTIFAEYKRVVNIMKKLVL